LKDRRGGARNQTTHFSATTPKTHPKKTSKVCPPPPYGPSTPICRKFKEGLRSPVLKIRPNLNGFPPRGGQGSAALPLDRDTRALTLFAVDCRRNKGGGDVE